MITVHEFEKRYGEFVAVSGVSFSVPKGAVAALVGQNGAGKTTTMRTLCGILRPSRGDLSVAGASIVADPISVKWRTAYVPDDPPLFLSLTVWEHLDFVATTYSIENWEAIADGLCERFDLVEKKHVLASGLSRGMRQKVAIVCAYLRSPDVLLLDEPMTGLDPPSIRTLKDTIREQGDRGATILVSSHLLSLVEDLCDHLVLMRKGSVLYCGSMEEARTEFGGSEQSLEEVFFRLTNGDLMAGAGNDRSTGESQSPYESKVEESSGEQDA
ncbi:MAG: ABC transporter ATP-binding protein [Planctomycetota bacterium]